MEELALVLPAMWADHHVLAVHGVLTALPGVQDVAASALRRTVEVRFDPAATDAKAIAAALSGAGYEPGELDPGEAPPKNKPAWALLGKRTTTTDPLDQSMSGDYRRY